MYNLLYYQTVAAISCNLSPIERQGIIHNTSSTHIQCFSDALALVNEVLDQTELYTEDDGAGCSNSPQVNILALEQQVMSMYTKCNL